MTNQNDRNNESHKIGRKNWENLCQVDRSHCFPMSTPLFAAKSTKILHPNHHEMTDRVEIPGSHYRGQGQVCVALRIATGRVPMGMCEWEMSIYVCDVEYQEFIFCKHGLRMWLSRSREREREKEKEREREREREKEKERERERERKRERERI
jgi:signal transduction histidine kinase